MTVLNQYEQAALDAAPESLKEGFDATLHNHLFSGELDNTAYVGYAAKPLLNDAPPKEQIELSNVAVSSASARKVGDIWWMPENEAFTLTADVALPDSELMIMSERVINGDTVVDDMRFIANIANGQVTINGTFKTSGNYQITAERLNSGLARIGMPIELIFNKIEFDVYV